MSEEEDRETPREYLGRKAGGVLSELRALKLREPRPDFVRRVLQKVAGGTPLDELELERKVLSAHSIGDAYTDFVPYIAANDIVVLEDENGHRLTFGVLSSGREMSKGRRDYGPNRRGLKALVVSEDRVKEAEFLGTRSSEGYLDYGFWRGGKPVFRGEMQGASDFLIDSVTVWREPVSGLERFAATE